VEDEIVVQPEDRPKPPPPIPCVTDASAEPVERLVKCDKCGWFHTLVDDVGEAIGEAFENRQ
jgi:hypothetical protein